MGTHEGPALEKGYGKVGNNVRGYQKGGLILIFPQKSGATPNWVKERMQEASP